MARRRQAAPLEAGTAVAYSAPVGPVGATALAYSAPVGPVVSPAAPAGGVYGAGGYGTGVYGGAPPPPPPGPITLEQELVLDDVKITVVVPVGADRLTVWRTGPSGVPATVRAAVEITVSAGAIVLRDYEPPLGVPLVYTAQLWAAASPELRTTDTATITLSSNAGDNPWLVDLGRPTNTQRVVIEHMDDLELQQASGVHAVLGRRSPIVTADLAQTPRFTLQLITLEDLDAARARAALGNGLPLLLRTPPEQGVGNLYLFATGWHEQRLQLAAYALRPERRFVIAAQQVERPDPSLFAPQPPVNYAAVLAAFADYATLLADRGTYDAVTYDFAVGTPSIAVPWPPTDV